MEHVRYGRRVSRLSAPVDFDAVPLVRSLVGAFAVVCQFLNSATGGHMNPVTTHVRSCPAGVSRLFILGILLAASVCVVSQDKQAVNANAGKDEDDIKRLISMYAKAADEADPALASRIWCDSSDDSLINPVGRWQGVEE